MNRQQIKKWSLLRHLNFKGYKRTASGNPLNMVKVMSPSQLTIYGNAVQDGTPSPDAPVEVQLCGDKTGNLLDVSNFPSGSSGYVENGSIYVTSYIYQPGITPEDFLEMTGLQVGDEITTTANYKRLVTPSGSNGAEYIIFLRKQPNGEFLPLFKPNTVLNWTVPTDFNSSNYYAMYIYGGTTQTDDGSPRSVWSNLAIYKGSYTADTLPAYEPYGYKVSGRAEGLNLFDKDNATLGYRLTGNGEVYNSDSAGKNSFVSDYISVDPNTIYSLNYVMTATESNGYERASFYDADKQFVSKANDGARTFTTPQNASYVRLCRLQTHLDDTMLLKGSYTAETMPPYEPYQPPQDFAVYLPEQIAKVGDVADEVVVDMEKQTAELRKNVGSMILDGSESWIGKYMLADSTNRYTIQNELRDTYGALRGFCDRLPKVVVPVWTHNNVEGFLLNSTQIHLSLLNTDLGVTEEDDSSSRTQKFKEFLSTHQATVYAPLATPVTTDITSLQQWDAMPQVSGTVSITFDSAIPISNAETEYYSKEYDAT